jgi:hypothetical protein
MKLAARTLAPLGLLFLAATGVGACAAPTDGGEATGSDRADLSLWHPISVIETVDIHADPEIIWRDLLTTSCYSHWNPWLHPATDTTHPAQGAEMEVGDDVTATVITATGSSLSQSVVTVATAPGTPGQPEGQIAQFCWRDTIPVASWFIPAYRCRTLTANADGSVHYTHDLELQGVLDWLAADIESASLHKGMGAENEALKTLAESGTMDPMTCAVR